MDQNVTSEYSDTQPSIGLCRTGEAHTDDCVDGCVCVCQHQGSRWARPRARLSALCQALFISSRASPQRFCTSGSSSSRWGRSTCVRRQQATRLSTQRKRQAVCLLKRSAKNKKLFKKNIKEILFVFAFFLKSIVSV